MKDSVDHGCMGSTTVAQAEPAKGEPWIPTVGLLAFVVAVHSPMLFIHPWGDDFENLRLAYSIHESPWRALQPNYLFFRPLMLLSMYLEYRLSATSPLGLNLVTLLLLVGNVLLVGVAARRLGLGTWAATATALLYGTSPLMSEATTWSGTRADQLMVTWCLLLIVVALTPWRSTSWRFQLATGGLLMIAACTKESWIVLPVILGSLLLVMRREKLRTTVRACAFGGALALAYGLYFVVWPELAGAKTPLDYSAEVNTPPQAVLKLLRVLAWYSGLGHPEDSGLWGVVGGVLVAMVLIGGAMIGRRRAAIFALLLTVLPLLPTLHFPVSPTRFNALPLVGFWIAVVALAAPVVSGRPFRAKVAVGALAGLTLLQTVYQRLEIADYRWYGELHRRLVAAVEEVEPMLLAPGLVVVLNAGTFDGPGAFRHEVRGMVKYIYPKPGGMWDLVFFPSLAEFAGRPFELRIRPVVGDRLVSEGIDAAVVLVFTDAGFAPCEECREEVRRWLAAGEPLPERIGVYEVVPVGVSRAIDAAATPRTAP